MGSSKRFAEERQQEIVAYLNKNKSAEVEDLVAEFNVSGTTIRTDLRELENRNLITRTHGGAMILDNQVIKDNIIDPVYLSRIKQNQDLKIKIGRAVAVLIENDESIMLDDGSTTLQVAKSIPREKKLTVITNGLNICLELSKMKNAEIVSTGGIFRIDDLSFNGKISEATVSKFHANKAILGASGISVAHGLTAPDEFKAELKKTMIDSCTELIIVADYTKLERVSLLPVCEINRVTTLVTDDLAPKDLVKRYMDLGIKVILAN